MQGSFERRLWTGRRFFITDLRIVSVDGGITRELALDDIGDVQRSERGWQRLAGLSTIEVWPTDHRRSRIVLPNVRRGTQLAALIELLAADPAARLVETVQQTMSWDPTAVTPGKREALTAMAVVLVSLIAVVVGLHGKSAAIVYPSDDAIYPGGTKRDRAEIVRFMEASVMPWARRSLAPIVGGPEKVTCQTCHGIGAEANGWRMPAVAALPRPVVREAGWENYGAPMDAQMRNAIYGYSADPSKAPRAAYMREVVMPGMARLLNRPAYDFTRTYEFNREQFAFGCYHCHRVK